MAAHDHADEAVAAPAGRARRAAAEHRDVVVVGGGIAGSAMATVLGEAGLSVTVVERTRAFVDRVRGDAIAPWGVRELERLGLLDDLLADGGGRELRYWDTWQAPASRRRDDLRRVEPHRRGVLAFSHWRGQDALLRRARHSGATVVRDATARLRRHRGAPLVEVGDRSIRCRLVIAADGRNSALRSLVPGQVRRDPCTHHVTGAVIAVGELDASAVATAHIGSGRILLVPLGAGRARMYYMGRRLPGDARRLDEFVGRILVRASDAIGRALRTTRPLGPIGSFPNACVWSERPWGDGVVLIGDAAGALDPSIGQGLAIAIRDVRELSDALCACDRLADAAERYATARASYFGIQRLVAQCNWAADRPSLERRRIAERLSDPRRARARHALMQEIRWDPGAVPPSGARRRILLGAEPAADDGPDLHATA